MVYMGFFSLLRFDLTASLRIGRFLFARGVV
jgi:hypothetical protein